MSFSAVKKKGIRVQIRLVVKEQTADRPYLRLNFLSELGANLPNVYYRS